MMVPVRVLVKQCLPDEAESRPSRASDGLPGRQCQAPQGPSPAGRPGATARESPPNQAAARAAAALRLGSTISAALAHHPLPSFSLSPSTPLPFSLFPFLVLPSPHPLQSLRLPVPLRAVPSVRLPGLTILFGLGPNGRGPGARCQPSGAMARGRSV